jgi:hypothetical protein
VKVADITEPTLPATKAQVYTTVNYGTDGAWKNPEQFVTPGTYCMRGNDYTILDVTSSSWGVTVLPAYYGNAPLPYYNYITQIAINNFLGTSNVPGRVFIRQRKGQYVDGTETPTWTGLRYLRQTPGI